MIEKNSRLTQAKQVSQNTSHSWQRSEGANYPPPGSHGSPSPDAAASSQHPAAPLAVRPAALAVTWMMPALANRFDRKSHFKCQAMGACRCMLSLTQDSSLGKAAAHLDGLHLLLCLCKQSSAPCQLLFCGCQLTLDVLQLLQEVGDLQSDMRRKY